MTHRRLGIATAAFLSTAAAPTPAPPPPVARYSMDVITSGSTLPMQGNATHALDLKLWAKGAPSAPRAIHAVPAGLGMGPSLTLAADPSTNMTTMDGGEAVMPEMPKGRVLLYWGCGEAIGAGQPKITDFAKMAMDPRTQAMMRKGMRGGTYTTRDDPREARWPNKDERRTLTPASTIVGAHKVTSGYSPDMAFSLGAGQDFMPALGLKAGAPLPSGAIPLTWNALPMATGYYLSFAGANAANDIVMWVSSANGAQGSLDFASPDEVKKRIANGTALAPTTTRCVLPAAVAKAVPMGAVQGVGYGPYVGFSDRPKAPTWTTLVRYKSDAMTMTGMPEMPDVGAMIGSRAIPGTAPTAPAPKKKKKFGLGDVLKAVAPVAVPIP